MKHIVNIRVPPGVDSSLRLVMRGEGDAGIRGGAYGDLYINVRVQPHESFIRIEDDIIYVLPVNFVQAALGDEVEVPTLSGKTKVKIPPGSQTGRTFRLKGQGISHFNRNGRGDQIVILVVVTPDSLTDKQRKLLKELGASLTEENMPSTVKWRGWLESLLSSFGALKK